MISIFYTALYELANKSRNINIYRTAFHTLRIFTLQAARCLCRCLFSIVSKTYFFKVLGTYLRFLLTYRNSLHYIYFHCYPPFEVFILFCSIINGTGHIHRDGYHLPAISTLLCLLLSCTYADAALPGQSQPNVHQTQVHLHRQI